LAINDVKSISYLGYINHQRQY